jgi:hypothetical protein
MKLQLSALPVVAAAATLALATVTVAPAQAAIIAGSTIQFGAPLNGGVDITSGSLNFDGGLVDAQATSVTDGTSSFFFPGSPLSVTARLLATSLSARVQDIPFTVAAPVTDFFKANFFINPSTGFGGSNPFGLVTSVPVSFRLDNFLFNSGTGVGTGSGLLTRGADTSQATFDFSTQLPGGPLTSYSATITAIPAAVPTPALLPGLLGLGAAAWRKRQSEDAAVEA